MTTANLTISLITNTIDRADSLRTLLRALEHQSYPHFEVIVVVGPTHDHTLAVLADYEDRLQILHCPQANLGQSRNLGLLAARGEIVVYIDDDAVPCHHWLAQLTRLFGDANLDATGGVVYMIHPDQPTVQHRIGIVSSLAEQENVRASWLTHIPPPGTGRQWVGRMMGTNMAFRRQALLEIGGFDAFFEWVYDDTDVAIRLAQQGKIIHPVQEAVVYHVPASSRNRQIFSFNAKWWVQTKSVFYFSLKNGPKAGDSLKAILLRCLHFVRGHWLWSGELWHGKRLTRGQFIKMRFEEVRHALIGGYYGLFHSRSLILNAPRAQMTVTPSASIVPFQNEQSASQPTVDPVTGRRPTITLSEPPLRICLLSANYPPNQFEGVGHHTNLMAKGLFECGHTVHVIAKGDRDEVSFYDGAYVHRVATTLTRYNRYRLLPTLHHSLNHSHAVYDKVRRLRLNDGIQVVDSPVWQLDGLVTAVSQTVPVVARLQTALRQISAMQHTQDADAQLVGDMEQSLIAQAVYLVPNSWATLKTAQTMYDVNPEQAAHTIIPHGIVPVAQAAIRPFDVTTDHPTLTILYLGRLEKRKGITDLFQAVPQVLEAIPPARFIIAGADNSRHDGFYASQGQDYPTYFARRFPHLKTRVTFTGPVSETEKERLYQQCDLFVAPSLYESFGLIYLEAMNYAKPVIGCQVGGIPEVIDNGVTGRLVAPETGAALAEAIISLLQSPRTMRDMGLAGRERLLEKFTYVQMARQFAEVYRQVIQQWAVEKHTT